MALFACQSEQHIAHATGVVGPNGKGTAELYNVRGKIDATTCTLSKAIGSIGGAICGSRALIKHLSHMCRQFIFTSALPPSVAAASIASLDVIENDKTLLASLRKNCTTIQHELNHLGFNLLKSESAIIPLILKDDYQAYEMARRLEEKGVFVNPVTPPAVPKSLCRLRISVMATHTDDHLEKILKAFKTVGQEMKII